MASCTLLSKSCFNTSLLQAALKHKSIHPKKITTSPVHRLATTTSIVDNTRTHGRLPTFQLFNHKKQRQDVHLVSFTSVEGKRLFRNAMVQGHAESFFKLMGNFSTQSSSSQGGVCSLAMVLNALEIDPKRIWKGNWRWFSSEQMKTCSPAESIQERGIPFDEFTCLAQTYCKVQSKRAVSYSQFLADLESVTSDTVSQMVVNYSRTALGQHSHLASHFSPIGGYNKLENQVLIMDVARGEYPSVWVNTKDLYIAMMEPSPEEAGRSRGYFVLSNYDESKASTKPVLNTAAPSKLKCQDCSRKCHSKA